MISQFLAALSAAGLDVSAEEAADALWLASHICRPASVKGIGEEPQPERSHGPTEHELAANRFPLIGAASTPQPPSQGRNLYSPPATGGGAGSGGHHGGIVQSPGVPALPGALAIARALRPLKRRVPSRTYFVFDEEATVECIATGGPRVPVLKPSSERWFELALVVDQAPTLALWRQTIAELRLLLERHGAFRDVRVWGLNTGGRRLGLQAEWSGGLQSGTRSPRELVDPAGRRLVLVVSDFVSEAWYRREVAAAALTIWARSGPLALVQVLPSRLWPRTGLALTEKTSLAAPRPGVPNQRLRSSDVSQRWQPLGVGELAIPVLTLEPRAVSRWAGMVAGVAGVRMPGLKFEMAVASPIGMGEDRAPSGGEEEARQPTAAERVRAFRAGASLTARRLAGYLAAAPLSLPVMRLVQAVMLPESRQVHLAEVFLGGLLRQMTPEGLVGPEEVQYEFENGVRDLLLNEVRRHETIQVIEEISVWLERQAGMRYGFMAILEGKGTVEDVVVDDLSRPFARVAAGILRRLGKEYSSAVEKIERELEASGKSRESGYHPGPIPYGEPLSVEEGSAGSAAALREVGRLRVQSRNGVMSTVPDWKRKEPTSGRIQSSVSVGELHALFIGINDYIPGRLPDGRRYPSLKGAVSDVSEMALFLHNRYGLKQERTRMLLSRAGVDGEPTDLPAWRPTYTNIVAAFTQLAVEARPGDRVYIHYSGHGTRGPTEYPEIKGPAGMDEALVPCDIGEPHSRYLSDLELAALIQLLVNRKLHVTVVLDCSYSGGVLRGGERTAGLAVARSVPWARLESMSTTVADRQTLMEIWASQQGNLGFRRFAQKSRLPVARYTLFAACRPEEQAFEVALEGGEAQGALTHWLLNTLKRSADPLSCREIHQRLMARSRGRIARQTPMFRGDGELGFLAAPEIASPRAAPTKAPMESPRVLRLAKDGRVLIGVGLATGAKVGDRVVLRSSAELAVRQVGATESWAEVIRVLGAEPIEPGARIEFLSRAAVRLVSPEERSELAEREFARLRQGLRRVDDAFVEVFDDSIAPDLRVTIDENHYYEIQDPGGIPFANLSPLKATALGSAAKLLQRLDHLAKFRRVLTVANPHPPAWLKISLEVQKVPPENDQTQPASGPVDLREGESLILRIVNHSSVRLDFVLLDLAPDYSITQLLPKRGSFSLLTLDPGEGESVRVRGWLPQGWVHGKDVLKVFATHRAANFRWLELPPLTRSAPVLEREGETTASAAPVATPSTPNQNATREGLSPSEFPEEEWITAQLEIRVRRSGYAGVSSPHVLR